MLQNEREKRRRERLANGKNKDKITKYVKEREKES